MLSRANGEGVADRIRIQEKALSNLADTLRREDSALEEELGDIKAELKALKVFMSRNIPEFKKQFPEIQRKIK